MATHLSLDELHAGLDAVRSSPKDSGTLELIVRRPAVGERELLDEGELDLRVGLVGDTWIDRGSKKTPDGSSHPEMQLNVMNASAALLVAAGDAGRPALAGDQLFVDLDLSETNLPPGTRLAIGDAVIEITAEPHRGCAKFSERFGVGRHCHWCRQGIDTNRGDRVQAGGTNSRTSPSFLKGGKGCT